MALLVKTKIIWLILVAFGCWLEPQQLAAMAQYSIRIDMSRKALEFKEAAHIDLTMKDARLKNGACLYLPLEDPIAIKAAEIHTLRGKDSRDKKARSSAAVNWLDAEQLVPRGAGFYSLQNMGTEGFLQLSYSLTLAGWKDRPGPLRFVNDFYPQIFSSCAKSEAPSADLRPAPAQFNVQIKMPQGWSHLAPGQKQTDLTRSDLGWGYEGSSFYLVLYKTGTVHKIDLNGSTAHFLYQTQDFLQIEDAVTQILQHHHELLGAWPSKDFILVESQEYEPINTRGLIVINRPQQPLMRFLQEDFLHWNIWQLTLMLAEQWFSFDPLNAKLADIWLMQSLADSMGLLFLDRTQEFGNLFAKRGVDAPYFQLRFRQTQDIIASGLSSMQPHSALLDENVESKIDLIGPAPLAFIRSSQALRVLSQELGVIDFRRFLRSLRDTAQGQNLTPKLFLAILSRFDVARAESLSQLVKSYWQSDAWPDPKLIAIEAGHDGRKTRVFLESNSSLAVPIDVEVQGTLGRRQMQHVQPKDFAQGVEFDLPIDKVVRVELDPGREVYDSDRFNNQNDWPSWNFFPGNARTLVDDGYTILWSPFLQKLPGQKLSLQLGWQLFRYLGSGFSGWLIYAPDDGRKGYRISYKKRIPQQALSLKLDMAQDDGKTLFGERITDLTIARRPILKQWPGMSLFLRQRLRQVLGEPQASHMTSTLGTNFHFGQSAPCDWDLRLEHEQSTWVPLANFNYARDAGLAEFTCDWSLLQVRSRLFRGVASVGGQSLGGAQFNAQSIDEARLRLDYPHLPLSRRLASIGLDLVIPARLPLPPAFFVLPRRTQLKLFADVADLREPDHRAFTSGLGLVLPLGGDVIGKQTVTFIEFSLLAVLYRHVDDRIDRRPGLLFDFGGQL